MNAGNQLELVQGVCGGTRPAVSPFLPLSRGRDHHPAEPSRAELSRGERDVGMTMAPATRALPLACLVLLLLRRDPGVGAQVTQGFQLQQPQDKVSVKAGETLTLTCTVSSGSLLGPVKWLKGWGSGNQTIYEQTGSFPRVTRVVNGSITDFSIHIRDVQPEDAGTYYCAKFRKSVLDVEELIQRGKGTEVSVRGAGAHVIHGFQLQQPQDKVSVTVGKTLTLTCIVSPASPPGPVKWLKGWGSGNQTIYDLMSSFPRVTRAVSGSDTDFSIHIRDVQPEDAGTYYCAKFLKSVLDVEKLIQRGKGTEVSVRAQPTYPVVSGSGHRVGPGELVPFTCTAGGFFPEDITVKWFKNRTSISAQPPQITPGRTKASYNMSSTVTMTLREEDIRSQLICEVQHLTLRAPLRGTYQLGQALRVSPSVRVDADPPSPIGVNKTVKFTCHVEGFYPGNVAVTWLENGTEMSVENTFRLVEMPRGLFQLSSVVEVKATEEKNGSRFTCRVVHDAQVPVQRVTTLWIAAPDREGVSLNLLSSPGLWLGILLEKGLLGGLLVFLFKRARA